jgi:hypothetical protein
MRRLIQDPYDASPNDNGEQQDQNVVVGPGRRRIREDSRLDCYRKAGQVGGPGPGEGFRCPGDRQTDTDVE